MPKIYITAYKTHSLSTRRSNEKTSSIYIDTLLYTRLIYLISHMFCS